jgi:DNA-binding NtrC family response regulator
LVVEDDEASRTPLASLLNDAGHRVTEAADGAEAGRLCETRAFDVALIDVRLPKLDGLAVFRAIRASGAGTDVILMTGFASVPDAVAALRDGAVDYLLKPFDGAMVLRTLGRIAEQRAMEHSQAEARAILAAGEDAPELVGRCPAMAALIERVDLFSQSEAPVLISGESGVGKEVVARVLHARSVRRAAPFVAVNCAAFPETLLEAELFGHERGAFTGALKKREGRFKMADGGTLLLDEVAEIPLQAQAKLLRVLQEGTFEPLGTNAAVTVDVRILSATHRNLKEATASGRFREDLYYRLNVLDLSIPPLRERRSDLPLLLEHFLRRFVGPADPAPSITPRAWAALSQYDFPGNVRELAHIIERAVVLARGKEIDLPHLPAELGGSPEAGAEPTTPFRPLGEAVHEFEREYLLRALQLTAGKRARTAELLGISRKSLWEKLRNHGISDAELDDEP